MFRKGKHIDTRQRFTIKKFKIGAASVLIGTVFAGFGTHVQADEVTVAEPTVTTLASTEETIETGDAEPAAPVATEEATIEAPAETTPVVAETPVEVEEKAVLETSAEVTTESSKEETTIVDDSAAFVSEKATTKPVVKVEKPKSSAMPRPTNEGRSFTEGASFRADTTATPTVTTPMPEGYTIGSEKITGDLEKFSDNDPNHVTFAITKNDVTNAYFRYSYNKADKQYYITQMTADGNVVQTTTARGAGDTLYFEDGRTRIDLVGRESQEGSSNLAFATTYYKTAEGAKAGTGTDVQNAFLGVFSDGYPDKSSIGRKGTGTLTYYAPLEAYSVTEHINLLTGEKIRPDVVQAGYTGETYTTRAFDKAGEAGADFDVLRPLNAEGVLTTAAWREKGQVEETEVEVSAIIYKDGQRQKRTFIRKLRYEIVNDQGDMKIEMFMAEKPTDGSQPVFEKMPVINPELQKTVQYTVDNMTYNIKVSPIVTEDVIVKPSTSDSGPYNVPFAAYGTASGIGTEAVAKGFKPEEGWTISDSRGFIRNPYRRASDEVKYYYTQENAVVKFFDVTEGKNDLNEDVTGISGKGETAIKRDMGTNKSGKTVDEIIKKYEDLGYKVVKDGFTDNPTFKKTTATYPEYSPLTEEETAALAAPDLTEEKRKEIMAKVEARREEERQVNEAERRDANKQTVEITLVKKKGSVVVNYVDENGTPLLSPNTVVDNQPIMNVVGDTATPNKYDTTPETIKHPRIESEGKVYELVPTKSAVRTGEGQFAVANTPVNNETGNVAEETTYVNYVYKEKPKGSVVVNYRIEGDETTPIKAPVNDTTDAYVGTDYTTTEHKTPEITYNGKTYVLVPNQTPANETGTVTEGTTTVTYYYKEKEAPVTPAPKEQLAKLIFREVPSKEDTSTETELNVDKFPLTKEQNVTGTTGGTITFTNIAEAKAQLEAAGYELVSDNFSGKNATYDDVDGNTQEFKILVTPKVTPITPEEPGKPGEPIDPNNPGPKWPTDKGVEDVKREITRTVTYVKKDGDVETPVEGESTNKVTYTRTGKINHVTGEVTWDAWTPKDGDKTLEGNPLPTVPGYTATEATKKVGEEGATEVTPNSTTENVDTPFDGKNIVEKVVFTPNPVTPKQQSVIIFEDATNKTAEGNNTELTRTGVVEGEAGNPISPNTPSTVANSTEATIKYYEERGYKVTTNGFDSTPIYDNVEGNVQEVKIVLEHQEIPVTPDKPKTPTDPLHPTPEDPTTPIPDSPNYPEGVSEKDLKKTVTRTVYYWIEKENGEKAFEPVTETVTFTRTAYVDSVTGEVKRYSDWSVGKFTEVESPTKDGYTVDRPLVGEKSFLSQEEINALPNGKEFVEHVIYTPIPEAPKTGTVVIEYVDTKGNPIKTPVVDDKDVPVGTDYDTTDEEGDNPSTITVGKDKYVLVPSLTKGTENGKVVEGTTTITYVYQKVANWIPELPAVPDKDRPRTPYPFNPEEPKNPIPGIPTNPETGIPVIPHVDGYVPNVPGTTDPLQPVDPKDPSKGYIPPSPENIEEDTRIPYTPVKRGTVIVHYEDTAGNVLKTPVTDENNVPVGTDYNTTDEGDKPTKLTHDGENYVLVPSKTRGTEEGKVVEGTTEVTYFYQKVANWIPLIPGEPNPPKTPYPFDPTKPEDPIPTDPKVPGVPVIPYVPGYEPEIPLTPVDPEDPTKGYIPPTPETPGKDTPIPYVPAKGTVIVKYRDVDGNPLKDPVTDEDNVPVGTEYNTTDEGDKPSTLVHDGENYVLVPSLTEGTEEGKVTKGTTTITYVYQKVANWIPLIPGEPNPPKTPYPFNPEKPNDPIPAIPEVPGKPGVPVIPYVPGYEPEIPLQPVDPEDPSKGYIPPVPETPGKDTPIPYVPAKGTVIVKYRDVDGNPLKDPVTDEDNVPVGTEYNTTDEGDKPSTLVHDGENYVLVPSLTEGTEEGKVTKGTTTITYVYQKVANWIPLIPGEPNPPKTPYPFNPEKPNDPIPAIPEVPGKPGVPVIPYVPGYEPEIPLQPVDPEDPSKGYIPPVPETPGKDTPIPYKPANGTVVIEYKDVDGNVIKTPVRDEDNVPVGTEYNTTDEGDKPTTIVHDGETYVLVPSLTEGTEEGKVTKGTTTITYVYQKVANWIPELPAVPDKDRPRTPYPFDPSKPGDPIPAVPEVPGKPGVPVIPHVPGYEPVDPSNPTDPLKPVDPKDPNKGYIPPVPETPGKDTRIPYVPAYGTVVIEYKDVNGNPIKSPVTDENNVRVDTPYNTTDEGDKPTTIITEDGTRYVLVPSLTVGDEEGKVTKGTTTITYVYQKVANWIPLIPGEPNPPKTPYPFDPENPGNPIPAVPEVPGKPGVPVIPFVPGYEPFDPTDPTKPLQPVDPEDPSKGYIPPVPTTPGEDTLIPYKPVPPTTPNIPGVEIPEQPTDPGKPTPPAEPGKPVEPGQPTPPAEPGKPTPPAEPGKPAEPTTMTELPKTGDAGSVAASAFGIGTLLASLGLVAPRRKKD